MEFSSCTVCDKMIYERKGVCSDCKEKERRKKPTKEDIFLVGHVSNSIVFKSQALAEKYLANSSKKCVNVGTEIIGNFNIWQGCCATGYNSGKPTKERFKNIKMNSIDNKQNMIYVNYGNLEIPFIKKDIPEEIIALIDKHNIISKCNHFSKYNHKTYLDLIEMGYHESTSKEIVSDCKEVRLFLFEVNELAKKLGVL